MPDQILKGCRILVVEDEFLLADELAAELEKAGAVVLGPVGTLEDAIALIEVEKQVDGVVLDVNLRGEMVFPAADLLMMRDVSFLFTTGYSASAIPLRFAHIIRCEKPTDMGRVAQALGRVIHDQSCEATFQVASVDQKDAPLLEPQS